jgi:hypothetical protein
MAVFASGYANCATITIDFEGLADGTLVGSTYSGEGVTFTSATVITAGISLNEADFPPKSGQNVATDDGGPIGVFFSFDATSFSAYFTYATSLQLTAFDASNSPITSATSTFTENFVSSGNPPNEFIQLSGIGIRSVTIEGDPAGASFVMDDVTIDTSLAEAGAVPEPSQFALTCVGFLFAMTARRFSMRNKR